VTTRAKRRTTTASELDQMSDDDLQHIWFFGNVFRGRVCTFTATAEEQDRAVEILKAHGYFDKPPASVTLPSNGIDTLRTTE
jgi:hypothetical protein